jgi:NAD(P)H-hydrate repair Nnr-like enzyme with NAD(P)H-hydrate epimerase domain
MEATPTVLWSTQPHAGYDISSVAVIRIAGDASVVVGGSDDGSVTVFAGPGNNGGQTRPGAR